MGWANGHLVDGWTVWQEDGWADGPPRICGWVGVDGRLEEWVDEGMGRGSVWAGGWLAVQIMGEWKREVGAFLVLKLWATSPTSN